MRLRSCPKMYTCLAVLLSLIRAVHLLEINVSCATPFQCRDGSYALITGTDLTLQYDYGYEFAKVYSFHLYEAFTGRHLFDYESAAGQAFIKDNRLKSYEWTDKGIRFIITDIVKEKDQGKYVCDVDVGAEYKEGSVEVKDFFDPPAEMKLNTPSGVKENFVLKKGFGEHIFDVSAEPNAAITCSSVKITWVSSAKGNLMSCPSEDVRGPTVCPLILKESDMTEDECVTLTVYAEQYGVRSKNKTYTVCYNSTNEPPASDDAGHTNIIVGVTIGVLVPLCIILILVIVYLKRKLTRFNRQHKKSNKLNKEEDLLLSRLVPPWLRRNAAQGRPVRPSTNQNAENMQNSSSSSQSVASPIQATPSNTTESVHQNVNTATEQPAESKSQESTKEESNSEGKPSDSIPTPLQITNRQPVRPPQSSATVCIIDAPVVMDAPTNKVLPDTSAATTNKSEPPRKASTGKIKDRDSTLKELKDFCANFKVKQSEKQSSPVTATSVTNNTYNHPPPQQTTPTQQQTHHWTTPLGHTPTPPRHLKPGIIQQAPRQPSPPGAAVMVQPAHPQKTQQPPTHMLHQIGAQQKQQQSQATAVNPQPQAPPPSQQVQQQGLPPTQQMERNDKKEEEDSVSKKSMLNPNAKEFALYPNAKEFVPSRPAVSAPSQGATPPWPATQSPVMTGHGGQQVQPLVPAQAPCMSTKQRVPSVVTVPPRPDLQAAMTGPPLVAGHPAMAQPQYVQYTRRLPTDILKRLR